MTRILQGTDFRLLDASIELDALEDHLQLIESQMHRLKKTNRLKVDKYIRSKGLTPDDPEWYGTLQERQDRVDSLPRLFRGPFLVSLFAAYESIVTEIANLIRDGQSQKITIEDLEGDFLKRAKKYYQRTLRFELCSQQEIWNRIRMLSALRNAYAHRNGRMDMLTQKVKSQIESCMRQGPGISIHYGYIICDATTVDEIFRAVRGSLDDLISRYKDWDNQQNQT